MPLNVDNETKIATTIGAAIAVIGAIVVGTWTVAGYNNRIVGLEDRYGEVSEAVSHIRDLSASLERIEMSLIRATEDRWTRNDMILWQTQFSALNPDVELPEVR